MADEILAKLDAMEASLGERFDRLEAKVDRLQEDFTSHQRLTTGNFETILETLRALHGTKP